MGKTLTPSNFPSSPSSSSSLHCSLYFLSASFTSPSLSPFLSPFLSPSYPTFPISLPSLSSYFPAPLLSYFLPLPLSLPFPPPSGQERLLQVGHKIRDRSESPVVPPVGESVEIVTGPPDQDHTAMQQFDGASFKRAATGSLNWERLAAKNPRLTEG